MNGCYFYHKEKVNKKKRDFIINASPRQPAGDNGGCYTGIGDASSRRPWLIPPPVPCLRWRNPTKAVR